MGPTVSVGKSVNWVGQCIKYELFFPKVHFVLILQLGCQCIKYELFFPKVHFFLILKLCLAPVFNFFPLSDLKYNLSQISEKIGFFRENVGIFPIFSEKSAIFRRNFFKRFFHGFFFSTSADNRKIAEISADFSDF